MLHVVEHKPSVQGEAIDEERCVRELEYWKARGVNVQQLGKLMDFGKLGGALAAVGVGFRTDVVRTFVAVKRIISVELEDGVLDGHVFVGLDAKDLSDLYCSVAMALDRKGGKPSAFIGVKVRLREFFEDLARRNAAGAANKSTQ